MRNEGLAIISSSKSKLIIIYRAQDVEYNVPPEYLINFAIRDKLTAPALKVLQEDLLFFLFYTNIGDKMQLMAASEL